ncbi:hypothetical protein L6R50_06675 [Myxococcota bacterium]|nr:hypothetical protein [Myxococcota bacterium]
MLATTTEGPRAARQEDRPPWAHLLVLALVGAAARVGLRAGLGLAAPFGEDAEFWGYRAVEIAGGTWAGHHPPLYPLLAVLAAGGAGGPALAIAAERLALAAGVLGPSTFGLGMWAVGGRRAGIAAGWLAALLPNLLAWSLRVEPTSTFVVLLGVALLLAGHAARTASPLSAAALGVVAFLLGITKENGFVYLPLLGVPVCMAAGRRWLRVAAPALAAFLLLMLPFAWHDGRATREHGVLAKAALPMRDVRAMLDTGVIPKPLVNQSGDDAFLARLAPAVERLGSPEATPGRRLVLFAGVQAGRLTRFLGLWLVAAAVSVGWLARLWRRGALPTWQAALGLGLQAPLLLTLAVVVQARHAEVAALGTCAALALCLPHGWRAVAGGWPLAAGGIGLALQGVWLFWQVEVPRARAIEARARCRMDAAAWIGTRLPPGASLCSTQPWVGFYLGMESRDCMEPASRVRPRLYVLGTQDDPPGEAWWTDPWYAELVREVDRANVPPCGWMVLSRLDVGP